MTPVTIAMPEAARLRRVSNVLFLVAGILLGVAVVVTFSALYIPAGFTSLYEAQRMVPVFMVTERVAAILRVLLPAVAAGTLIAGVVLVMLQPKPEGVQATPAA